jgi:hypothetical protein
MEELTINDALCIIHGGWSGDDEGELFNIACRMIKKESEKLHLKYQLQKVNQKLKELDKSYLHKGNIIL